MSIPPQQIYFLPIFGEFLILLNCIRIVRLHEFFLEIIPYY
ncbi:Uncharacterised protein [Enterobacter cloacae]|uniref:Uncharacterized protein n=1 Tax=Enterobacter cloacae TaxID=550 RepID=A0A144IY93_ENTCL|nr:Uncharacterised protein [Enterobacter cloacae]